MSDDWEIRSHDTSFKTHVFAGSMAGLSEHLSMLPLDNIKTHCQTTDKPKIRDIARKIYQSGGVRNFFSGSSVLVMSCIPAHGLFFSIYQYAMQAFGLNHVQRGQHHPYLYGAVGAIAAAFHDFIMTPAQAIKQRLQLLRAEHNKISPLGVVKNMYKYQGIRSFYRAFAINYFTNVPFSALIVALNEQLKTSLIGQGEQTYIKYFLCSGLAGLMATIPTTPFDVIKTKMNTQDCVKNVPLNLNGDHAPFCNSGLRDKHDLRTDRSKRSLFRQTLSTPICNSKSYASACGASYCVKYPTVSSTIVKIFQQYGVKGFFKGLKMRLLIQTPSSSISWGTYQFFKKVLSTPKTQH